MLFDPIFTYLYVSPYFSLSFDLAYVTMSMPIHISTRVGEPLIVDRVYHSCFMTLSGYETWVDIIILDIINFHVILGDRLAFSSSSYS